MPTLHSQIEKLSRQLQMKAEREIQEKQRKAAIQKALKIIEKRPQMQPYQFAKTY